MNAIVLAAGQGRRLRPWTERLPKCLIPIGGKPILAHMLERIARCGPSDVLLAVGFEADQIRREVERLALPSLRVRFIANERFAETNNIYSLWLALQKHSGPATILNGDDFFNWEILDRLEKSPGEAAAAVDFTRPLPADAMRAIVTGKRVAALGKTLPERLASGNAIGLYRFAAKMLALLREEIETRVRLGRVQDFYVAAIDALAAQVPVRAVSTRGLTWGEIDDARDLAAAPAKMARVLAEERCAALHDGRGRRRVLCEAALLAAHAIDRPAAEPAGEIR